MTTHAALWARDRDLSPVAVDWVLAVMLKTIDGKCKMAAGDEGLQGTATGGGVVGGAVRSR
ncbi:hypothetical protein [Magnetospira sp. QH-2]|uniref:hypothetical protein n=1 Tax=Magnetospira sp. (strain QH-2) TaxID=1288970 RepID=UPI0003E815A9|nr:hypothetical protein [Magnetospira sp. QH-2]CCQ72298.1 protein of unknown function [Magnetospira sp. QH-2]